MSAAFGSAATNEVTRRAARPIEIDVCEDELSGAKADIDNVYRRKLVGLRYLRRSERPHALRAARDWRKSALRALREKRAVERHARRTLRQLLTPELR